MSEHTSAPQSRDDRVRLLSDVLAQGEWLGGSIAIDFLGINPPDCGVSDCTIALDDLPGGFVAGTIAVGLLPMKTGDRWNDAGHGQGRGSYSSQQRDRALRATGWTVEGKARRTIEIDPADPVAVGTVVDAIDDVFGACASVPGAAPAPAVTWDVHLAPVSVAATSATTSPADAVPPDEGWVEDATEQDICDRLVRLAGLRGGEVVVRPTHAAGVELVLTARRRGRRIEVRGTDPMTSWRAKWTMTAALPSAAQIHRDLQAALAGFESGDRPPSLSVRLEQHDEAAAWSSDSGYLFLLGWLPALGIVAAIAWVAHPPGTDALVGLLDLGFAGLTLESLLLGAVALSSAVVAGFASWVVEELTADLGLGYTVSRWLSVGAAAVASAGFLVVLIMAGSSWGLVVAAPWILGAAAMAASGIVRRLRHRPARAAANR